MKMKYLLFTLISLLLIGCGNTVKIPPKNIHNKNKVKNEKVIKKIDYSIIEMKPSQNDIFFTREYTYRANDDDSKNSSRKKAIQQMKTILSEEIGTHIESSLEMNTMSSNATSYTYIKDEIKTLSVAITKLKILNEEWNGKTFYIKARVRVNPEQTLELLKQSVKNKSSKEDIKKLNALISKQKLKLNNINRQVTLQEFIDKDSKKKNNLELNLGYMINQKYACLKIGTINKNGFFTMIKDTSNPLRFYISSNNTLYTESGSVLSNEVPHIYTDKKRQITLYVENDKRYLLIANKNKLDTSLLYECVETKYWSIIK